MIIHTLPSRGHILEALSPESIIILPVVHVHKANFIDVQEAQVVMAERPKGYVSFIFCDGLTAKDK